MLHHPGVAEIWRFGDKRWSAECTPNHRWIAERLNSYGKVADPPSLIQLRDKRTSHRVILAREANPGPGLPISMDEAALLGWIADDGWERKA